MPRGPTGAYVLPELPFVPNTPALAAEVNSNFSDIGAVLSASLDRFGNGGMLAPLRGADGTLAAPAFSFSAEPNSGLRRAGPGDLRIGALGAELLQLTAALARIESALTVFGGNIEANQGSFSAALESFSLTVTNGAAVGSLVSSSSIQGASLQLSGAATIGTTLGVTGVATFGAQASFTSGADMTGDRVVNVGTPVSTSDATTKSYVDAAAASLSAQIASETQRGHAVVGFGASNTNIPAGNSYIPPGWAPTEAVFQGSWIATANGTLQYLRVFCAVTHDTTASFRILRNGINTALFIQLVAGVVSGSDLINTQEIFAGDRISLLAFVTGGTTPPGKISASVRFTAV